MIYITGDLHGGIDKSKLDTENFPEQETMTKSDYLIITGDFGCIWDDSEEQAWLLEWLEHKNFTTLFIDGNHENFDLLNSFPITEWNGGNVHQISNSIYHLMRGQIFMIDGQKIFTFGGAQSHDREYREEFVSWWRQEVPTIEEFAEGIDNLKKHKLNVDIVLTHTAPTERVLQLDETKKDDLTCVMLDHLEQRMNYKHWYHGHFHIDQTTDKFTAVFNEIKCCKFA